MKKREFMNRLAQLIADLPQDERIEALQYYEDYFADAGDDKEQIILEELGSPELLAAAIRKEIKQGSEVPKKEFYYMEDASLSMGGYEEPKQESAYQNYAQDGEGRRDYQWQKRGMTGGKLACIIAGCIFLGPLIIGFGAAAFGLLIALCATVAAVLLAFGIGGFALVAAGAACTVFGIVNLFQDMPRGLLAVGAGLAAIGLGFLFLAVFMTLLKYAKLLLVKLLAGCSHLFHRKRVYA